MANDSMQHFPFTHLPKEIRLRVLRYSDLVDDRFGSEYQQALVYSHGRLQITPFHTANPASLHTDDTSCKHCPHILSGALLRVSKQLYDEAFETMLANNLLILKSGLVQDLKFLESLPLSVRIRIRNLDIEFTCHDFSTDFGFFCCIFQSIPDFDRLVEYIAGNLQLSHLNLTLDLLFPASLDSIGNAESAVALRALKRLGRPLPKLRGIKRLHVFLPFHTLYEEPLERLAVGPHYDSLQDEKVPWLRRAEGAIHAFLDPYNRKDWYRMALIDAATRPYLGTRSVEQIVRCCSNQEWFDGMPMPPVAFDHHGRYMPGFHAGLWYGPQYGNALNRCMASEWGNRSRRTRRKRKGQTII